MPTVIDLGQRVKAKFPGAYSDMSDAEVGRLVKSKFKGSYDDFDDTNLTASELAVRRFAKGAAKTVGKFAASVSEVGERGLQKVLSPLGVPKVKPVGTELKELGVFEEEKGLTDKELRAERAGSIAGEAALFLAPTGRVVGAQKVLGAAAKTLQNPIARMTTRGVAFAAPEAIATGSITALTDDDKSHIDDNILIALGLGAAGRGISALKKISADQAPRFVNSLVRPLLKDLSYGKNPGRGVARAGIIASSLEELGQKISQKRAEVGQQIGGLLNTDENLSKTIDLTDALAPIEDTIQKLRKAPRTNLASIRRLEDIKDDLLGVTVNEAGERIITRDIAETNPLGAFELKQDIAELTKYTGNPSDDAFVNKALQKTYSGIKKKIGDAVPEIKDLNEQFADLASAEVATKYRDKILERQNLVSFNVRQSAATSSIVAGLLTGTITGSALFGLGAAALEKFILSTPRFKTFMAAWLAKTPADEKTRILNQVPVLRDAIQRVFGN